MSEPVLAVIAIAIGLLRVSRSAEQRSTEPPPPSERLHSASPMFVLLFGALGTGALVGLVRVFVPIGALTFGGGLAMVPAIEHAVVIDQGWLDPKTFADAVALGQITPGPIAICATFVGYRVGGLVGALVATFAMFAPAVAVAIAVGRSVERFRQSPFVQGALRALAPAVIGMLAGATVSLGRASIGGWLSAMIALASFLLLVRARASPLWPLLGGGLLYVVAGLVR